MLLQKQPWYLIQILLVLQLCEVPPACINFKNFEEATAGTHADKIGCKHEHKATQQQADHSHIHPSISVKACPMEILPVLGKKKNLSKNIKAAKQNMNLSLNHSLLSGQKVCWSVDMCYIGWWKNSTRDRNGAWRCLQCIGTTKVLGNCQRMPRTAPFTTEKLTGCLQWVPTSSETRKAAANAADHNNRLLKSKVNRRKLFPRCPHTPLCGLRMCWPICMLITGVYCILSNLFDIFRMIFLKF